MSWIYRRHFEDDTFCSEANLTALVDNNLVPYDPDITGIGVLTGFLVTSISAFITVLVAYTTYSIPTELINEADNVISALFRRKFVFIRKIFRKNPIARTRASDHRDDRTKAFTAFLLSVSDQILVSEVAILIAAFAGHEDITIYSVDIIVALGCLASTVHLLTLPLVIRRIKDDMITKTLRVVVLTTVAGMLLCLLCYRFSDDWDSQTTVFFRCVRLRGAKNTFITSFIVPAALIVGTVDAVVLVYWPGNANRNTSENGSTGQEMELRAPSGQNTSPSLTMGSKDSHSSREDISQRGDSINFAESQSDNEPSHQETDQVPQGGRDSTVHHNTVRGERCGSSMATDLRQRLPTEHGQEQQIELQELDLEQGLDHARQSTHQQQTQSHGSNDQIVDIQVNRQGFWEKFKEIITLSQLNRETENRIFMLYQQAAARSALDRGASAQNLNMRSLKLAFNWARHAFETSLIWRLLWVWAGTVYGLTAIFVARANTTGMSGEPDKFGFGQVVPLALLMLPIFAAMQSMHEYRRATDEYCEDTPSENEEVEEGEHVEGGEPGQRDGYEDCLAHVDLVAWSRGQKPANSLQFKMLVCLYFILMLTVMSALGVSAAFPVELFLLPLTLASIILLAILVRFVSVVQFIWRAEPKSWGPSQHPVSEGIN